MATDQKADVLLSGEYSRRRSYLNGAMYNWNALAITGTLAIWGFFLQWSALLGPNRDPSLFATQVAWASALSSVLLGLWRFHSRQLDDSVVRLYPAMYWCERVLLPSELCTVGPPKDTPALSKDQLLNGSVDWTDVSNRKFGGRGHGVADVIASGTIAGFGFASVATGSSLGVSSVRWLGTPHLIGYLLLGNCAGLLLIGFGWHWWRNRRVKWPVPTKSQTPENRPNHALHPTAAADGTSGRG